MAGFISGDVVVVPFPFTDLSSVKVRPALVLAALTRGDLILCQITSQAAGHPEAVPILTSITHKPSKPRRYPGPLVRQSSLGDGGSVVEASPAGQGGQNECRILFPFPF